VTSRAQGKSPDPGRFLSFELDGLMIICFADALKVDSCKTTVMWEQMGGIKSALVLRFKALKKVKMLAVNRAPNYGRILQPFPKVLQYGKKAASIPC